MSWPTDITTELDDATLEFAARFIVESTSISEDFPRRLKRKRDREDLALKLKTMAELRESLAAKLPEVKKRDNVSPTQILRGIADDIGSSHYLGDVIHLVDAWPLAWRGWLTIESRIKCNSNSIPPRVSYHIELTDKGREVLAVTK
jgi:hypothetical protein